MPKWLREPLLHFLLLGAALFVLYGWVGGPAPGERSNIAITPGRIEQMTVTFQRTHQRLPDPGELDELIEDAVREEIYYREALALGLDRDDTIVRRRLRQKLEFVTEEVAPEPSVTVLEAFLQKHPELFRAERSYSLSQLYLDPERHGPRLAEDAKLWLTELERRGGPSADPTGLGDPSLLPPGMDRVGAGELSRLFGMQFEQAAQALPVGQWTGPVTSGVGAHLVLLREREEERAPALSDVRDEVRRQWALGWRAEANTRYYAELRQRYVVTVTRPGAAKTGTVQP